MSQPRVKRHDYEQHQEAELARWPGVTYSRQVRAKHYALVLTFGGVSRFVTYPTSPGDTTRGALNHLRDVRKACAELGATRLRSVKATGAKRQRNRTEPARLNLGERVTGGPCRDPWAALATLEIPAPQPKAAPVAAAAPSPWWRRLLRWLGDRKSVV